jgi:hypothetical protein
VNDYCLNGAVIEQTSVTVVAELPSVNRAVTVTDGRAVRSESPLNWRAEGGVTLT